MSLDEEGLYSLVVEPVALRTASITPGQHVIDAFCGAGGSAIGFARSGKRVTAIELCPHRLDMARHNAALFGVADRIEFVLGDAISLVPTIVADALYLAPPWGGPAYTRRDRFTLDCFAPDGHAILAAAAATSRPVVMQVPRTFDLGELERMGLAFSAFEDRLDGELLSLTLVLPRLI